MDEKTRFLKVVPPSQKEVDEVGPHLDPLDRFKGMVLNLTESASDRLNRISQREMQKDSPLPTLMEEYFLLHHNLDFIERLCRDEKCTASHPPLEKYFLLHEPMHLDPLDRFRGVVLNLTESALDCLNRISQREMQKDSPSPTLVEEYFLLHHYLDFIERLCRGKKDSSSQTLLEEYLLLHESMHFE
jgi:hypothetical protein